MVFQHRIPVASHLAAIEERKSLQRPHIRKLANQVGRTGEIPVQFPFPFNGFLQQQRVEFPPDQIPQWHNLTPAGPLPRRPMKVYHLTTQDTHIS